MAITEPSQSLVKAPPVSSQSQPQRPLDFGLIRRLFQYTRPYALKRNLLLGTVLVRSIQLPALTGLITATIQGPIQRQDSEGLLIGAMAFLAMALSTQFVMHYRQRMALELGESVVRDLRHSIFRHVQEMPLAWYDQTRVGQLISRIGSDVEDVRLGVQDVLFVSLVQIGQMLVSAACMAWYDWRLFLLAISLAPLTWYMNQRFHRHLSHATRQMRESYSRVTATLAESVGGIRVTHAFVRQGENARQFSDLAEDHSRYNTAVMEVQGLFVPLLELNGQLCLALVLLAGGWRVLSADNGLSPADLIAFFFMAGLFYSPVSVLGNQYNQAITAMAAAERVFQLLDTKPAWSDSHCVGNLGPIHGDVEFQSVTFGYSEATTALREVSFRVSAGETLAIVGETGSGKSSIVNLLAKFYLPRSGRILVDGVDLATVPGRQLHEQMGMVLQRNHLFQGSVEDNIRFGRRSASTSQILDALRQLDCMDLLEGLPAGLDTQVGERGSNLSSGQRQLVCFARAMLTNPRILILDEATSSIDSQTERRLQAALRILLQGRTSVVVAHRLSTIRQADRILVVDKGRIVEQGQHTTLLAQEGPYARLHRRSVQMPPLSPPHDETAAQSTQRAPSRAA